MTECECKTFTTHTTHGDPWCLCGHQYARHAAGGACTYADEPTYTAAEVKVLTEAALRLGRKEAAEEIAEAMDAYPGGGMISTSVVAMLARNLVSLPAQAASDATSVPSEGPGTSEPSKAAKTPEPANPTVDLVGALRKAVDAARERRLAEREDRA